MFEYEGNEYTLQELEGFSQEQGIEFEAFMTSMKDFGMISKNQALTDNVTPITSGFSGVSGGVAVGKLGDPKSEKLPPPMFKMNDGSWTSDVNVIKKKVYHNQETDVDKLVEYTEEDFEKWLGKILPNSNVTGNQTGFGNAIEVKLPGVPTFEIDLKPMTSGEGSFNVAMFGAGAKGAKEKIARIIKYAENRYKDNNSTALYTDWTGNKFSDRINEGGIRFVKSFEELQKMYEKVGLVVKKERVAYAGDVFTVYDTFKDKQVFRGKAEINGGIADFMHDYAENLSKDQLTTLQLERKAVAYKNITNGAALEEILAFDNNDFQNIAKSSVYDDNKALEEKTETLNNTRKELNNKAKYENKLLTKQINSIFC